MPATYLGDGQILQFQKKIFKAHKKLDYKLKAILQDVCTVYKESRT